MKLMHSLIDIFKYKEQYQLETCQLHPQDMYVLERIYFEKSIRVMDISKNYHIPPSTLTGIIDRLYEKEYIQRIRSEKDRRAVALMVTASGEKIVEQHIMEDRNFVKNFFHTIEPQRREALQQLLVELVMKIDKNTLFMDK
ncbi:MarR family winged helix-turn-helix transcriptional regulator [Anaerosolibacter sp.]|uniref:MarR family winged helix-turn-helix transcriptional regulator n=1 Tax=Anaerosolibacter sp. TaxID=1872527 RepID=UPI002610D585|nr:MarR family transcriptional regulator [Anaerosolibacter sp.]